jgi:hypothetical protein
MWPRALPGTVKEEVYESANPSPDPCRTSRAIYNMIANNLLEREDQREARDHEPVISPSSDASFASCEERLGFGDSTAIVRTGGAVCYMLPCRVLLLALLIRSISWSMGEPIVEMERVSEAAACDKSYGLSLSKRLLR